MADDAQIRIGLSIDTSGLDAGKSRAQADADAIAAAYDKVAVAALEVSNVQKQHIAVIKSYRDQTLSQQQAEVALAANLERAAAATAALSEAKIELKTITDAETNSENRETEAIVRGISSRQAATAVIGGFEGRMMSSNRAAAAFLSTTLGLGPALQAAFPIIGALALGSVLVEIGKNAYNAYEKFVSLDSVSKKLLEDFKKMAEADFINVRSIETATERLDKATKSATNLREAAQGIHDASFSGAIVNLATGNLAAAGTDIGGLLGARKLADQSSVDTKQSIALGVKQVELQHELNIAKIEAVHAGDMGLEPEKRITAELQKHLALAKEEEAYNHRREQIMGNVTPSTSGDEMRKLQDEKSEREAAGQREELSRTERGRAAMEMVKEQEDAAKEADRVTKEVQERAVQGLRLEEEETKRLSEEERKAQETAKKDYEEDLRLIQVETDALVRQAAQAEAASNQNIRHREKMGTLAPRGGAQEEIYASTDAESKQVSALQQQASSLTPEAGGEQLQKFQEIQNKITQIMEQGANKREQIANQEAEREHAAFDRSFSSIEQGLTGLLNTWLTTHESMGQAAVHMADKMAVSVIDALAKIALQEIVGMAIHKTVGDTTRLDDARTAASGAYAATAGIPYIGPILAPIAAATAFAAVAAFEKGGIVPGRHGEAVPIMAHANEAVLPAPLTSMLIGAAGAGGGSQGGHSFTSVYSPQISVLDSKGLESFARRAGDVHGREMARFARRMNSTM